MRCHNRHNQNDEDEDEDEDLLLLWYRPGVSEKLHEKSSNKLIRNYSI